MQKWRLFGKLYGTIVTLLEKSMSSHVDIFSVDKRHFGTADNFQINLLCDMGRFVTENHDILEQKCLINRMAPKSHF